MTNSNKMAKIALVGLLAAQGCSPRGSIPTEQNVPTEQENVDKLEKELKGYHLHQYFANPEAIERPWYVELRKVPPELRNKSNWELLDHPQYGNLVMFDENEDGKPDFASWMRPLGMPDQLGGRIENMSPKVREVFQKTFREHRKASLEEMSPKVRAIYRKAYSNHQAFRRNYKK